jgi:hypothetical protein
MSDDDYPVLGKACVFIDDCEEADWDWSWDENAQEQTTYVRAERGSETIEVHWHGNRLESVLYTHDGETYRNLPNVAKARERLNGEPEEPKERGRPKVKAREVDEVCAFGDIIIKPRILPFDPDIANDDEIISYVRGKTIVWWNRTSLNYEKAQVWPPRQVNIWIDESSKGKAFLTFVSPEGFRSVALDCLVQVV